MAGRKAEDKAYSLETKSQTCTKCNVRKSFDNFGKNEKGFCGLHSRCKDCRNENTKIWMRNNPERKKAVQKIYQEKNREKILSIQRSYYQNNKELIRQKNAEHYLRNREKILNRRREKTKV